jgi:hypothetical protein
MLLPQLNCFQFSIPTPASGSCSYLVAREARELSEFYAHDRVAVSLAKHAFRDVRAGNRSGGAALAGVRRAIWLCTAKLRDGAKGRGAALDLHRLGARADTRPFAWIAPPKIAPPNRERLNNGTRAPSGGAVHSNAAGSIPIRSRHTAMPLAARDPMRLLLRRLFAIRGGPLG